jgi:HEAT repeat protein
MSWVDYYLKRLEPGHPPEVRRIAADGLRGCTDARILEPLERATRDEDPQLRLAAARTLAEAAALLSANTAQSALDDPEIATIEALDLLGQPLAHAARALQRALDDADPLVRVHAAGLLAAVPHAAAIEALRRLRGDERTALLAAGMLALRGDGESIELVVSVLAGAGESPERRWAAARSAIHLDDDRARQALCDALTDTELLAAWLEFDASADLPRVLELAAASPSQDLADAARGAQRWLDAQLEAGDDISIDVDDLVSTSGDVRADARQAVVDEGAEVSIDELIALVDAHFDRETVLSDIAQVLAHLADRSAETCLRRLAAHEDWMTRLYAIGALGELGAVEPLCDALASDPSVYVRAGAVKALSRFPGDALAGAALTRAVIGDPSLFADGYDERVFRRAGVALRDIGYRDGIPELMAALGHERPTVRCAASWALGELRATEAGDALRGMLEREQVGYVQRAAAWAIGMIRDPAATPILLTLFSAGRHTDIRKEAAFALGEIGDAAAVPALLEALSPPSKESARVVWALGLIKAREAVARLLELLEGHPSANLRQTAAVALGTIGDKRVTSRLVVALARERDAGAKAAIIRAIGELDGTEAVRAVEAFVDDPDDRTRRAAVNTLGRIGDARSSSILHSVASRDTSPQVRRSASRAHEVLQHRLEPEDEPPAA